MFAVLTGDDKDRQPFCNVCLYPRGELRLRPLVKIDELLDFFLRVMCFGRFENIANMTGNLLMHVEFRRVMHRVLYQMNITALQETPAKVAWRATLSPSWVSLTISFSP